MINLNDILNNESPFLILMVGTPLSGKSTLIKKIMDNINIDIEVISRDDILLKICKTDDYDKAWDKILSDKKIDKKIDKNLKYTLVQLGKSDKNVIIDMTNLSKKGRHKHLAKFPKHNKIAIIFDFLSDDEYIKRNNSRKLAENKTISLKVIERMKLAYNEPSYNEFDYIINSKEIQFK